MGRDTQRVMSNPLPPDGRSIPILMVSHGQYQVVVADQRTCIVVSFDVGIPEDVRKKLAELSSEDKRRATITLHTELSSNTRAGYALNPPDATYIDQLLGFNVAEVLKIEENDVSSFNRFCDAIQETVAVGGKGISVFGVFSSFQPQSTIPVPSAPKRMYT